MKSPIKISITTSKLKNKKVNSEPVRINIEHPQESDNDWHFEQADDFATKTSDDAMFKCARCLSDVLLTLPQLKFHYKVHHKGKRLPDKTKVPEEYLICECCDTRFSTPEYLEEHLTNEHSKEYECETCRAEFKKALDYVIHRRKHADDDMFQCIYCEHKTATVSDIKSHLSVTHGTKYRYTCKTCHKGFQSLLRFKTHDNFHTGKKPFVCELCGKAFPCSTYLPRHKMEAHREEHTGKKMLECDICHKQYRYAAGLSLHKIKHTGNFPTCDVCGKQVSSRYHLKFHMRTHTGEKPFKCSYCEKCFSKNDRLKEHTRTHTGERPYVCEYCPKSFTQRSSLTIHTRCHTGEKPYVCEGCKRGFVSRASLNIHKKNCDG